MLTSRCIFQLFVIKTKIVISRMRRQHENQRQIRQNDNDHGRGTVSRWIILAPGIHVAVLWTRKATQTLQSSCWRPSMIASIHWHVAYSSIKFGFGAFVGVQALSSLSRFLRQFLFCFFCAPTRTHCTTGEGRRACSLVSRGSLGRGFKFLSSYSWQKYVQKTQAVLLEII